MRSDNEFDIIHSMKKNKLKIYKKNGLSFVNFDDMKREMLKDKNLKKEYDALELEYQIIRAIIKKRIEKKKSQRNLAKSLNTYQSAIARLESGKASPTLSVVSRLLAELGAKVKIS